MRSAARCSTIAGVRAKRDVTEAANPLTVVLELAPVREPIEGRVRSDVGEPRAFVGWMELVAALESMLEKASPQIHSGRAGAGDKED
jgi:hypothetical protein